MYDKIKAHRFMPNNPTAETSSDTIKSKRRMSENAPGKGSWLTEASCANIFGANLATRITSANPNK